MKCAGSIRALWQKKAGHLRPWLASQGPGKSVDPSEAKGIEKESINKMSWCF